MSFSKFVEIYRLSYTKPFSTQIILGGLQNQQERLLFGIEKYIVMAVSIYAIEFNSCVPELSWNEGPFSNGPQIIVLYIEFYKTKLM